MGFKHVKEEFEKLSIDDLRSDSGEGLTRFLYWQLRLMFEIFGTLDSIDQRQRELIQVEKEFLKRTQAVKIDRDKGGPVGGWNEEAGW